MQFNNPFNSIIFLKQFKNINKNDVLNKIKKLETDNLDQYELIFMLTKTLLDYHLFFTLEKEVREWLIYESSYWASKQETKTKRPSEFSEDMSSKQDRFLTKLTKSLIDSLIVKYKLSSEDIVSSNIKSIKFNLELNNYLSFMNSVACIKRDRRLYK